MTRLQSHRSNQTNKRIIILILLSLVLMVVFFQVGLKVAISAAVFVNNVLKGESADATPETQDEDFFGILNVDEPHAATNSASIVISGDASEYKKVDFYINNVKVEDDTISRSGTFEKEIGKLRVGENNVYVLAKDESGKHTKKSEVYSVTFMNEKPTLELETPKDGDKVTKPELQIKGKTDKDVTIRVNNSPVVVSIDGSFTSTYRLKEGENKLQITATDIAGNEEKKELTVRYEREE